MKTRLYSRDIHEILIENHYPNYFYDPESEITERKHTGDFFFGKGSYIELYFKGIHIGYGDLALGNTTLIHMESDFETVEMHFALSGSSATTADTGKSIAAFHGNQHNIIYAAGFSGISEWQAGRPMEIFEVNLLPEFFTNYLPDHTLTFREFARSISNKNTGCINKNNMQITFQMSTIINEIIHCNRIGKYKRMLIESKVIELLLLQLEQIETQGSTRNTSLSKTDIDKMFAAKEIILANLETPCSLVSLAHQVGTNEFTLKKGFKEIFGTTVFGYLSDVKMERAKAMLSEQGLPVNQVSELSGYKNAVHFTHAFKRKFGILPSTLKRF